MPYEGTCIYLFQTQKDAQLLLCLWEWREGRQDQESRVFPQPIACNWTQGREGKDEDNVTCPINKGVEIQSRKAVSIDVAIIYAA